MEYSWQLRPEFGWGYRTRVAWRAPVSAAYVAVNTTVMSLWNEINKAPESLTTQTKVSNG